MLSGLPKFRHSNDNIRRWAGWLEFATSVIKNRCSETKSLENAHILLGDRNINSYQICSGSVSRQSLVIDAFAFAQGVFGLGRLSRLFPVDNKLHVTIDFVYQAHQLV